MEALYPCFYSEDPLPNLEARKVGNEGLASQHEDLNFTSSESQYRRVGLGTFPETRSAKLKRVWRNYNSLREAVVHSQQPQTMVFDIIVTHNFFVRDVALQIDPELVPNRAAYCCVTSFKLEREQQDELRDAADINQATTTTLLLSCNSDHVSK